MSSDVVVQVESLGKAYPLLNSAKDRLTHFLFPHRMPEGRLYWALRDLSFEVKKGETLGIVGKNGSGKSTLLQIICGVLRPSRGNVQTKGRIAALLELGSEFSPEFSGRENIYLNAAILGLSQREIKARFDAIVEFADIGNFLDQPLKTYSSGMALRLAFAVQAQVEPDLLIVDEALSVGDARFQAKCFERLQQLKDRGTSIILVSHSAEQIVSHCTRALLLDSGCKLEEGPPRDVVNRYLDLLYGQDSQQVQTPPDQERGPVSSVVQGGAAQELFHTRSSYNPGEYRWGDRAATITDFQFAINEMAYPPVVESGAKGELLVWIRFHEDIIRPVFGMTLKTKEGVTLYGINTEIQASTGFEKMGQKGAAVLIRVKLNFHLAGGDYFVSVGIASLSRGADAVPHDRRYDAIHLRVAPTPQFLGLSDLGGTLEVTSC